MHIGLEKGLFDEGFPPTARFQVCMNARFRLQKTATSGDAAVCINVLSVHNPLTILHCLRVHFVSHNITDPFQKVRTIV